MEPDPAGEWVRWEDVAALAIKEANRYRWLRDRPGLSVFTGERIRFRPFDSPHEIEVGQIGATDLDEAIDAQLTRSAPVIAGQTRNDVDSGPVERKRWTCLLCNSLREGHHGTLDDKVTPCPNGVPPPREAQRDAFVAELVAGLRRAEEKRKQDIAALPPGTCTTCMGEGYLGSIESQRVSACPDCTGGVQVMAGARIAVMAGGVWLQRDTPEGSRNFGFDTTGVAPVDLHDYAQRISEATGVPLADGVTGGQHQTPPQSNADGQEAPRG